PVDEANALISSFTKRPLLSLVAIHVHVGRQSASAQARGGAREFVAAMAADCIRKGVAIEYVDVGGGLGIDYHGHETVSTADYVSAIVGPVQSTGLPIVAELGRAIVGPAGALVARVVDMKPRNAVSDFAVIDAGMTELMRPALYGAYHRIEAVRPSDAAARQYEIVGPVCESSDVVG